MKRSSELLKLRALLVLVLVLVLALVLALVLVLVLLRRRLVLLLPLALLMLECRSVVVAAGVGGQAGVDCGRAPRRHGGRSEGGR